MDLTILTLKVEEEVRRNMTMAMKMKRRIRNNRVRI
jgi:hypothetical protein